VCNAGTPARNWLKLGVRVDGRGTSVTFKQLRNPMSSWRDMAKVCSSAQLSGLRTRGWKRMEKCSDSPETRDIGSSQWH